MRLSRFSLFAPAALCALSALAAAPYVAHAQTTAVTYTSGGTFGVFGTATGYRFTPTTNLSVTALGVFDVGSDGLANSHDVGIFLASDSSLVTSLTVPSGTGAPLIDGSRFVNLPSSAALTAGTAYYILSNNFGTDQFVFGNTAVVFNPQVTFQGYVQGSSDSISSTPSFFGGQNGNLGPNFRFTTAPAAVGPEPGTLPLLGMGLTLGAGMGGAVKRRKAKGKAKQAA